MSSFDKTMKFNFPEEPIEQEVKEVLLQVHDALKKKGIIRSIKLSVIYYPVILLIFLGIKMQGILFVNLNEMKLLKNW